MKFSQHTIKDSNKLTAKQLAMYKFLSKTKVPDKIKVTKIVRMSRCLDLTLYEII